MEFTSEELDSLFPETTPEPDPVIDTDPDPEPEPEPEPLTKNEDTEPDEIAASYYELLKTQGLLDVPDDFEFDKTPAKLQEALQLTDQRRSAQLEATLRAKVAPELQPFFDYALAGGKDIQSYLAAYQEIDYDELDTADEGTQKAIMFEYYKQTSPYSDEKIHKIIARLDPNELEEAAIETIQELKELAEKRKRDLIRNAKEAEEQKQKNIQAQTDKLISVIDKTESFDTSRKNRIRTFMFVPVNDGESTMTQFQRAMSQITNNPEHLVQLADILADYNPKKGFSFERRDKQLQTGAARTFREILHSKADPRVAIKTGVQDNPKDDLNWAQYFNNY